jgi:hypothetical protein
MYKLVASLALTLAVLGGCAGQDQATGTPSDSPSPSPSPSPSATTSPPPAASDAQAVIAYLLLPDDAGMGPYAGWKKRQSLEGSAKHLSLCSSHENKEIVSDAKVDYQTSRLAQYADANSLNILTESVVFMTSGTGPGIVERKNEYDGTCSSGNTTPLTTGFAAPQDFPDTKAFCSHPRVDLPNLLRCSTALGRGHIYVQIEADAYEEKDAAANLTKALAIVASRLVRLPA